MTFYLNTAGKVAATVFGLEILKAGVTGDSSDLKSGCLFGLVAWLTWVGFVLTTIYWLIFK